jgi:hypothetical protein
LAACRVNESLIEALLHSALLHLLLADLLAKAKALTG